MISTESRGGEPSRAPELPERQKAIRAKCFHPSGTFSEFSREEIEQSARAVEIAVNRSAPASPGISRKFRVPRESHKKPAL